jgi:hypothetical protein
MNCWRAIAISATLAAHELVSNSPNSRNRNRGEQHLHHAFSDKRFRIDVNDERPTLGTTVSRAPVARRR